MLTGMTEEATALVQDVFGAPQSRLGEPEHDDR